MAVAVGPYSGPELLFRCEACGAPGDFEETDAVREELTSLLARDASVLALQEFIARNLPPRGNAHPTHWAILSAKEAIVRMLSGGYLATLPDAELRKLKNYKLDLLKDLLNVVDVLVPGRSSNRRALLSEYCINAFWKMDFVGLKVPEKLDLLEQYKQMFDAWDACAVAPPHRMQYNALRGKFDDLYKTLHHVVANAANLCSKNISG